MGKISRRDLLCSGLTLSAVSIIDHSAWGRVAASLAALESPLVLVEAESFASLGGWVIDQEFADQMGSAFLLAHGMGSPVKDARTEVTIPQTGTYRVWVRTRNWVAEWDAPGAPGRFQLLLDGKNLDPTFGTEGKNWHWQDGGNIRLREGKLSLALRDLTGFEGRCDAIVLSADTNFIPPDDGAELAAFRKLALHLPPQPEDAGDFDLVVAGGGMAGTAAAISAARLGLQVALIQDRPVLGGNTSSEIRVALGGVINLPPYPSLGVVVGELDPGRPGNARAAANYGDGQKLSVVQAEKNIHLFLNTHIFNVRKSGNKIEEIIARDLITSRELRFRGQFFADCTGDGSIGFLAGAAYRYGREPRSETGESLAPVVADRLVNGTSVMWYSEDAGKPVDYPETPWALQFNQQTMQNVLRGDWDWETGQHRDQIVEFERIRDYAFRAIYGNWSFQKNHSANKADFANKRLAWVAYLAGKRESRRLLGDVVLQQQDVQEQRAFPDACVTATWAIDLHRPQEKNAADFPGEEFRTVASYGRKTPYAIPYRCLYSRDIDNLFMAGRDISVTHVALGTVRVMRTTGMMGEVVGMAAAIAAKHNTTPRGVYQNHLPELQSFMERGVGKTALAPSPKSSVPKGYQLAWSDDFEGDALDQSRWAFFADTKRPAAHSPQNVALKKGNIVLAAERASAGQEPVYAGGGIVSKAAYGYGYFECKMRIMAGRGWHSSFRLVPPGTSETTPLAADFELGVMENDSANLTRYAVTAPHSGNGNSALERKEVTILPLSDYHVYGCEYKPGSISYFVDGDLLETVDLGSLPKAEVNICLTLAPSEARDAGPVDGTRVPGHVACDYIRFFQASETV